MLRLIVFNPQSIRRGFILAAVVRRSLSPKAAFVALSVLLAAAFLLHIAYGSSSVVSPLEVVTQIFRGPRGGTTENIVVWQLRLVRAVACLSVGAILGVAGSAFQALFRNPLAEPYVVGVSSGAAMGGAIGEVFGLGAFAAGTGQLLLSFVFGLASLLLVMSLAGRKGVTRMGTLLLAGVVIGSMLSALLSLVILAAGQDTNRVLRWLLGDASSVQWPSALILLAAAVICSVALARQAKKLNAFAAGEDTARRLGTDTRRLRWTVLLVGTAGTAIAVGSVGVIGFLGLVAPHIARKALGVDWRRSLPASALIGAALLLLSDALAQRGIPALTEMMGVSPVTDIPLGVVTALIGAPSLLILLRTRSDV